MHISNLLKGGFSLKVTARINKLKRKVVSTPKAICAERAFLVTESYKETEGEPMIIRRAKAFQKVLNEMSIYIGEGELIVGNHASSCNKVPVFPETGALWVEEQLDSFTKRSLNRYLITEKEKDILKKILPYWKGKTVLEIAPKLLPEETKAVFEQVYPVISPTLFLRNGVGHLVPNYKVVLENGFEGIKSEVIEKLNNLDASRPGNIKKMQFYRSILIVSDAASNFAERYSRLAEKLAAEEKDLVRKEELEEIAKVCRRVPKMPATTFHEALQSFFFLQLLIHIETDGLAESPGRFDQYMYPFLKKDLQEKKLDIEKAQELLDCTWLKMNEINKLSDVPPTTKYFGGVSMTQNIIIGGIDENGDDITNELSYMCLEADAHIRLPQPSLSIRIHSGSPENFLLKTVELIKKGGGKPAIFNDEIIVPALMNDGISLADARNYGIVGCVEPISSGNANGWTNAAMFNLAKCLELALHNGVCQLSGKKIGLSTGEAREFNNFEQVKDAFVKQVAYFIKHMVIMLNTWDQVHMELLPTPFVSAFVDGCIDKGQDLVEGGAKFNYTGPQGIGLADVADSLTAIKTLVFENKILTMEELISALENDFEGQENLRLLLRNKAPKYGNGDLLPDLMAREVGVIYCREIEKYWNPRGGKYRPGLFPVASNVPLGGVVGALPNGRKKGLPLADGISPVHGCDVNGPTAVIRSVARVNHAQATNGTLLNLKFHPSALKDERDLKKLISLIRVFASLKLMHVQFNVVSADDLRKAQQDPENNRDLMVRVAGYSAMFVDLDKKMQDDIIDRTEFML
ncbi:MAG: hypothetical protein PWQ67_2686 [Clostridia bacterium]|nr:hypothetical protein [Clostridia bacterium]MDN5324232.1 hypothetical protein [Clostridia bacterium]